MTEKFRGVNRFEGVGKFTDRVIRSLGLVLLGYILATQGQARADGSQRVIVDNLPKQLYFVSSTGAIAYYCQNWDELGSDRNHLCVTIPMEGTTQSAKFASPTGLHVDTTTAPVWSGGDTVIFECEKQDNGEGIHWQGCAAEDVSRNGFTVIADLPYWVHPDRLSTPVPTATALHYVPTPTETPQPTSTGVPQSSGQQ